MPPLKLPKIDLDAKLAQASQNIQDASVNPAMDFLQAASLGGSALSAQGLTAGNSLGAPVGRTGGTGGKSLGGAALQKLMHAVGQQESGGNYSSVNKSSGAMGKYQVMPQNIPSWSKAALGRAISPAKFLSSPKLQEAVAAYQLGKYLKRYGAEGAAQAWYGGEGSVGKRNTSGGAGYPTVGGYSDAIKRRMGR